MRWRRASGWRHWLLGAGAAGVLFAAIGGTFATLVASASTADWMATQPTNQVETAGLLSSPCLPVLPPLITCPPSPTPTPTASHSATPTPTSSSKATAKPSATVKTSHSSGSGTGSGSSSGGSHTSSSGGGGAGSSTSGGAENTPGSISPVAPPALTTLSPVSGISFGKAPFLWPLFIGLDVLGLGAVFFVLRKTWSKPVGD